MSKRIASNAREHAQTLLDKLDAGSVVLDKFDNAWQFGGIGRVGLHWYRAYGDDSMVSSYDLSYRYPFKVIHKA